MEIILPTSLADVTLKQYIAFKNIPEDLPENVYLDRLISVFTNIPMGSIRRISMKSRKHLIQKITKAVSDNPETLIETTTLDGVELGFIPNLDKISMGEFVDIDTYCKDYTTWSKLMSVLYRPIIEKRRLTYSIAPYDPEIRLDYEMLTMDVVFGSMVFFYALGNDLLNHTLKYLKETEKRPTLKETFPTSGDGTEQLSLLLKATAIELTKQRELLCIKL